MAQTWWLSKLVDLDRDGILPRSAWYVHIPYIRSEVPARTIESYIC